MMEIIAYIGALCIGLILGLIGGGGSILTVPILVYALSINPVLATAYSLFVVGSTALVGTIINAINKKIDYKIGFVFALPSLCAVYITRKWIVPAIPNQLLEINSFVITKDIGIMLFFAFIMIFSSYSMLKDKSKLEKKSTESKKPFNFPLIFIEGAIVGVITGLIGAGGGFLIIPALVLFAGLSMKKAVATSLLIISAKSLFGFIGDIGQNNIDWGFLFFFTFLSIIGIFVGTYLNRFIEGAKLKKLFAWFIIIVAVYIIGMELFV